MLVKKIAIKFYHVSFFLYKGKKLHEVNSTNLLSSSVWVFHSSVGRVRAFIAITTLMVIPSCILIHF